MKFCLLLLTITTSAFAAPMPPDVIYGEDNRIDTYASPSPFYKELAKSTAAMVLKKNLTLRGNTAELSSQSFRDVQKVCEKERFSDQPAASECSAFLVSPDTMVTAGHCMTAASTCEDAYFVFNYKVDDEHQTAISVSKDDVFKCTRIVKQALDSVTDFAVVKLDRPVRAYRPVKLASAEATVGTPLVMIGHPSGLPQKITDGAKLLSRSTKNFRANLDAFGGNSGSAVFNSKTGELVGILVNGANDFKFNKELDCKEVERIPEIGRGEGVSSFLQFSSFL
ncbi:MAG TPA: serine protease [Bacteriovoracaceae bacterium]|nr:serine protease [Bacteriovoracaceae bacterium]